MSYKSIDTLQKALSEKVFAHTKDSKKAAGRALGTLIEIITYYLLREWRLSDFISIERKLAEYGNSSITHNVEFTLHPLIKRTTNTITIKRGLDSKRIAKELAIGKDFSVKKNNLIEKGTIQKNACVIADNETIAINSNVDEIRNNIVEFTTCWQMAKPYAMVECKRVGVEEGNKKGPQTIEKAKQGAYVAQTTSSLQKIRNDKGEKYGIIYKDGKAIIKPYSDLLDEIINSNDLKLLKNFTLSVGVVSNHGNWFTSEDQNKELKVLAQSYDWLLFLTDEGLAQFITDLLLEPSIEYKPIQDAFMSSYKEGKKSNTFTKARINYAAHQALCNYFSNHIIEIERWFNIISPENNSLQMLKDTLSNLSSKKWEDLL
ncbi:MAG: hypothetical protein K6G25_03365 [Bacteroidales bacterium]|nr:hypothetical protein [Bacteroidales bacterium]